MPYFDLQVNGYGGFDFNQDDLTLSQLEVSCQKLAEDGVEGILATIITEKIDVMSRRLRKLVELRNQSPLIKRMIVGLHIEGPFINEQDGYRGAHPLDAVCPADVGKMRELLDASGGLVKIVTLAPERDPNMAVTRFLAEQGIAVSAGHSNASIDDLRAGIKAGVKLYTHLGNGCPMQQHRHDTIIQRVLSFADQLHITFIADGAHVPFFALMNYLKVADFDRAVIVTDAIAPAGLGPGRYTLGRWELDIGEDMVARSPDRSHLVGSALNMPGVVRNLSEQMGLSSELIEKLTWHNPRKAIGLS